VIDILGLGSAWPPFGPAGGAGFGAIAYRVYRNDGAGGPVDYATPVATTAGLGYTTPPLAAPGDWTYAVRPIDLGTGREDQGRDTILRLVLAADGSDITYRPGAPTGLAADPGGPGGLRATWSWVPDRPRDESRSPDGFRVWTSLHPAAIDYAAPPAATVPAGDDLLRYDAARTFDAALTGLAPDALHRVAVRAFNAWGEDPGTAYVVARAAGSLPGLPQALAAAPI
jgi:hypothetical protein